MRQDGRGPGVRAVTAEETVGRTNDRDEAALDVIDVDGPVVGKPAWRPVPGGRPPRRLQRASLAAAAAVILVAGFAAGGLFSESAPSSLPVVPSAEAACRSIGTGSPSPAFRIAGAPGDEIGVRGLPGDASLPIGETDPAWQLPAAEQSLTVETPRDLRLILATAVCAAEIEIEVAPAEAGADPRPNDRRDLLRTTLDPARHEFAFASPGEGDWVLRIVIRYWAAPGTDVRLSEAYFRVRVGDGPFATPTAVAAGPIVTPAASCGPIPEARGDVVLMLTTGGSDPVPGVEPGVAMPVVAVGLDEAIEITVADSACATSWTIDVRTADSIDPIEGVPNIFNDPARAAQNRWQFTLSGLVGEADLVVVARFGPALLVERLWRVTGAPFEVPPAFVVAADGRRAEGYVGCGLTLELATGYTAADQCGSIGYDGGGERFEVQAFESLTLEVPGWTIVGWSGQCGQVSVADGPAIFESGGCELGSFSVDGPGTPPPARFVLQPGDQVLQLQVTASRDGDRFGVPYYLPVSVR